jgi:hypothetical protein
MKKVILKVCHPINHCVNAVAQYRQIVDGAKVLQQKSMNRTIGPSTDQYGALKRYLCLQMAIMCKRTGL